MKKWISVLGIASCLMLVTAQAPAQLGKKKGSSGSSTSGGSGSSSGGGGRSESGRGNGGRNETTTGGGGSSNSGGLGRGGGSSNSSGGSGSSSGGLGRSGGNSSGGSGSSGGPGRGQGSTSGGTVQGSNGSNGQGPLGRVDRQGGSGLPQRGAPPQGVLGRRGGDSGRSGGTNYGDGNNNQAGRGNSGPINIDRGPIDLRGGTLPNQVTREDNPRARYRSGYYQYDNRWNDNNFWYPHYSFSYSNGCTISPWYYYSNLPGFILGNRITYIDNYQVNWGFGDPYRWVRYDNWNNNGWNDWGRDRDRDRRSELDYALDDLSRAWEDQDRRALDNLIPRRGRVGIYMDNRYCYSLDSSDFYDLMVDNINGTRTYRYDITSVRSSRNDAQVSARHDFTDAWGRRTTVYHHYRMQRDRGDYVITDFLVSSRPTGW